MIAFYLMLTIMGVAFTRPSAPAPGSGLLSGLSWTIENEKGVRGVTPQVVWEVVADFDVLDPAIETLVFSLSGAVETTAGAGTYNLLLGGTTGQADGTVVATLSSLAQAWELKSNSGAAQARPVGPILVKLSVQATAGNTAKIRGVTAAGKRN